MAKHGATTRLWKVIVGQGVGDLVLMSMYESFSEGAYSISKVFLEILNMAKLMDERSVKPCW